MPICVER